MWRLRGEVGNLVQIGNFSPSGGTAYALVLGTSPERVEGSNPSLDIMDDISTRRKEIEQKLKEHDAKRMIIAAELSALRYVCPHTNAREWDHRDYTGDVDHHWVCDDCGLRRRT